MTFYNTNTYGLPYLIVCEVHRVIILKNYNVYFILGISHFKVCLK